jgi:hypothetical protein
MRRSPLRRVALAILLLIGPAVVGLLTTGAGPEFIDETGRTVPVATVLPLDSDPAEACAYPHAGSLGNLAAADRRTGGIAPAEASRPSDHATLLVVRSTGFGIQLVRVDPRSSEPVRLERGAPLSVRLEGADGSPLPGAEVALVPLGICPAVVRSAPSLWIETAASDADGRIEFPILAPGAYALRIEVEPGAHQEVLPLVAGDGAGAYRVRFPEKPAPAWTLPAGPGHGIDGPGVRLIVRGAASGAPVRDLVVEVEPAAGRRSTWFVRAGEDGALVPWDGRRARLTVRRAAGGPGASATLGDAAARPALDLTLEEPASVEGEVIDAASKRLLPGAELVAWPESPEEARPVLARAARSADGTFRIPGLPAGAFRLEASAEGRFPASAPLLLAAGAASSGHLLALVAPGRIEGRLHGIPEGWNAIVHLYPTDRYESSASLETEPQEAGTFRFGRVRPATYRVLAYTYTASGEVGSSGLRQTWAEVRAGETTWVDMNVGGGHLVTGIARLGDDPLPSARIGFDRLEPWTPYASARASTDEEGRFAIVLPDPGRYEVMLEESAVIDWPARSRLTVQIDDAPSQEVDLRFPVGEIRGRLVDGEGRPVPKAWILLSVQDDSERIRSQYGARDTAHLEARHSHSDGTFRAPALPPGVYRFDFQADGFAPLEIDAIPLAADEVKDLGVLVLQRGASLRVLAVGPSGQPLNGAVVAALADGNLEAAGIPPAGTTGPDGIASIENLPPGRYGLLGLHPATAPGRSPLLDLPPEDPDVPAVLRFPEGGSLEVQAYGPEGSPRQGILVTLFDADGRDVTRLYTNLALVFGRGIETDASGLLVLEGLLPGRYTVSPWRRVGTGANVVVAPGARSTALLRLDD